MFIDDIKPKIMQTLRLFFELEQGNRVTIFNTSGLVSRIERDFKESEYIESDKQKKRKK